MKVLANFEDNKKIASNSSLDVLLEGGFERGVITQIFGPPTSGKSNITLTLAVNVARKGRKVIYIDTEGGISIERVKQIAGEDFSKVANNIIVFEPKTFLEQDDTLRSIDIWLRKNNDDVDLIVLDSAVALYRIDDMKSSKLNKELGKQMGVLSKIARTYDIAVIVNNQIYSAIGDDGKSDIKAVGGTILPYWSKVIIQLDRVEGVNQRKATLVRHRSINEGREAIFTITSNGIV